MEAMLAYLLKVSVSAILFYLFIRSGRLSSLWFSRSYMCPYCTWYLLSDCISGLNGLPGHMNTIAFSAAVLKKADAAGMYACV